MRDFTLVAIFVSVDFGYMRLYHVEACWRRRQAQSANPRARVRAMVVNAIEEKVMSEEEEVHEEDLATYARSPRT